MNRDLKIDLEDAVLCLRILVGISPDDVEDASDLNADGRIGLMEAAFIFQILAEVR